MHRITLCATLTLSLLTAGLTNPALPGFLAPALAQNAQSPKTRPIVAVLPTHATPFNNLLLQVLRRDLTEYEPTLINVTLGDDPAAALAAIRQAKATNAARVRVGDRELSEIETRWLLQSEMILVADWSYTPLALTGPHAPTPSEAAWTFKLESDLTVQLHQHRLDTEQAEPIQTFDEVIKVGKTIPIPDVANLQRLVQEVSGIEVDINNGLHQAVILDVVRKIPTFQQLQQQDPATYLEAESGQALAASTFPGLSASLKNLDSPPAGDGIASSNGDTIVLNPDEEARIDTTYLFENTFKRGNRDVTETVAFGKVRSFDDDKPVVHIIGGKDKITGNEAVVRNSKLGLNVDLRLGTVPLWITGGYQLQGQIAPEQFFRPAAQLDFEYNIGQWFGVSELFLTLGGGANMPVTLDQNSLNLQPPPIQGIPVQSPFTAAALGITGELGFLKRWFLGQMIIDTGLSGGILYGLLLNSGTPTPDNPSTLTYGGTARLGVSYQFTPEFIIGLQSGFRYYADGYWTASMQPVAFGPLSSWGPILQLNASYTF